MPGPRSDHSRLHWHTMHRSHALVRVHMTSTHSKLVHLLHGQHIWLPAHPRRRHLPMPMRSSSAPRWHLRTPSIALHGHAGLPHRVTLRHHALHAHVLWTSVLPEVAADSGLHLALSVEVLHRDGRHARVVVATGHALEHRSMRVLLVRCSPAHHLLLMLVLRRLLRMLRHN